MDGKNKTSTTIILYYSSGWQIKNKTLLVFAVKILLQLLFKDKDQQLNNDGRQLSEYTHTARIYTLYFYIFLLIFKGINYKVISRVPFLIYIGRNS